MRKNDLICAKSQKMYNELIMRRKSPGFTLIELLIVIVLIGVLSGFLLSVLNPGQLKRKAQEAVAKENLDKIRLAMVACFGTRKNPIESCRSFTNLGINDPTGRPTPTSMYYISKSNQIAWPNTIYAQVCMAGDYNYDPCTGCAMRYIINVDTGQVINKSTKGCIIEF